jgi:hypothetical protein
MKKYIEKFTACQPSMHSSLLLRVLGARLNFVSFQRKWPLLATETQVNSASVAQLLAGLASTPDGCSVRMAVAALWSRRITRRFVRAKIVVHVSVDELLWTELVSLLKVEAAGVAECVERLRVTSPEGGRGRFAV